MPADTYFRFYGFDRAVALTADGPAVVVDGPALTVDGPALTVDGPAVAADGPTRDGVSTARANGARRRNVTHRVAVASAASPRSVLLSPPHGRPRTHPHGSHTHSSAIAAR